MSMEAKREPLAIKITSGLFMHQHKYAPKDRVLIFNRYKAR